jgi:hypothetical protein
MATAVANGIMATDRARRPCGLSIVSLRHVRARAPHPCMQVFPEANIVTSLVDTLVRGAPCGIPHPRRQCRRAGRRFGRLIDSLAGPRCKSAAAADKIRPSEKHGTLC